jgi:chromate transporter
LTPSGVAGPPREPLLRLFLRFLRFGALAWGGPVAQIAMIQRELVDQERWVSRERFNRTLAVYQVLPGPEAHELCVWFGMLSRGRIGGLLAGLGFMLPGFVLMFLLSWAYLTVGLGNPAIAAIFAGIQAAVVALVARAVHRIARHALHDGWLFAAAVASFVAAVVSVPFALILGLAGSACALTVRGRRAAGAALLVALLVVSWTWLRAADEAPARPEVATMSGGATAPRLLLSGFKAGMLTFGGAYTAIPFLQRDAVERGGWMTTRTFLDGLALGGILPAPLIIFSTFVGFVAGGALGALAMTVGIFAPAFGMTLIAHEALERLIARPGVHGFLDGVTAGVVGLIAATLADLLRAGVTTTTGALIFCAALAGAFLLKARWSVALVVLGAGLAGWLAFVTMASVSP